MKSCLTTLLAILLSLVTVMVLFVAYIITNVPDYTYTCSDNTSTLQANFAGFWRPSGAGHGVLYRHILVDSNGNASYQRSTVFSILHAKKDIQDGLDRKLVATVRGEEVADANLPRDVNTWEIVGSTRIRITDLTMIGADTLEGESTVFDFKVVEDENQIDFRAIKKEIFHYYPIFGMKRTYLPPNDDQLPMSDFSVRRVFSDTKYVGCD